MDLIWHKAQHVVTHGLTIEEFQQEILVLFFTRFIIYPKKCNKITSAKTCAVAFMSFILRKMALNECIGACFPSLAFHPLLRNTCQEEINYREVSLASAGNRFLDDLVRHTSSHNSIIFSLFEIMVIFFARLISSISNLTDPTYVFSKT